MKITHFAKILAGNNAVKISDNLIVFNDFELYDMDKDESKNYDSLDDLIADNEDVKAIIEAAEYFSLDYSGGRGSLSGEMGGGFTSAGGRRRGEQETIQNAALNYGTAGGNSLTAVLGRFRDKYKDADTEYGTAVDEQGFVHNIQHGGKVSVDINGHKGETIIHNHPSGGNFSKGDLISTASSQEKGIIATSSNAKKVATYHLQKNNNFKAKAFIKAVNNARWPKEYSYDKGADWWLKRNQRAYGYKYSSKGLIGE